MTPTKYGFDDWVYTIWWLEPVPFIMKGRIIGVVNNLPLEVIYTFEHLGVIRSTSTSANEKELFVTFGEAKRYLKDYYLEKIQKVMEQKEND